MQESFGAYIPFVEMLGFEMCFSMTANPKFATHPKLNT